LAKTRARSVTLSLLAWFNFAGSVRLAMEALDYYILKPRNA
jgi:hypothetical protein